MITSYFKAAFGITIGVMGAILLAGCVIALLITVMDLL